MAAVPRALKEKVRQRANHRCEYCGLPEGLEPAPFEIDHITSRKHKGKTILGNLALSCLHCNGHKGPNLSGIDPVTRKVWLLFNPRKQKWLRHFRWDGPLLLGQTPVGRATIEVLAINDPDALEVRAALMADGLFPVDEP